MKNKKEKIDRRGFIEQSAKITAAGIMLSRLPAKSKKLFSIEGEIKVAIIGCGGSYHLKQDICPHLKLIQMLE